MMPLATRPEHTGRGGALRPGESTLGHLSFTCTVNGLSHLVSDEAAALVLLSSGAPIPRYVVIWSMPPRWSVPSVRCVAGAPEQSMTLPCRSRSNVAATAVLEVPDWADYFAGPKHGGLRHCSADGRVRRSSVLRPRQPRRKSPS